MASKYFLLFKDLKISRAPEFFRNHLNFFRENILEFFEFEKSKSLVFDASLHKLFRRIFHLLSAKTSQNL